MTLQQSVPKKSTPVTSEQQTSEVGGLRVTMVLGAQLAITQMQ